MVSQIVAAADQVFLIEPSAGDVFIDGQNVAKLPHAQLIDLRRRDMSMVFQSFALICSPPVSQKRPSKH